VVLVRARVLPSGQVGEIEIRRSSGHDVLDQAALDAVKRWKFNPAREDGEPVADWVSIPVRFNLQ
jgi:periplasmic protein TonB